MKNFPLIVSIWSNCEIPCSCTRIADFPSPLFFTKERGTHERTDESFTTKLFPLNSNALSFPKLLSASYSLAMRVGFPFIGTIEFNKKPLGIEYDFLSNPVVAISCGEILTEKCSVPARAIVGNRTERFAVEFSVNPQ